MGQGIWRETGWYQLLTGKDNLYNLARVKGTDSEMQGLLSHQLTKRDIKTQRIT